MAVGISVAVAVLIAAAVLTGGTCNRRPMLARKGADAVADAVLSVSELVLAFRHAGFHLLAPHVRVQAAGGRCSGDSDRGHGHRDACQQLERKCGSRTPEKSSHD